MKKSLAQLYSLVNLVEQLEAVQGGKLGALSSYHLLSSLLEAKLVQCLEKTLNYLLEEE